MVFNTRKVFYVDQMEVISTHIILNIGHFLTEGHSIVHILDIWNNSLLLSVVTILDNRMPQHRPTGKWYRCFMKGVRMWCSMGAEF